MPTGEVYTNISLDELVAINDAFDECKFLACNWANGDLSDQRFAECTFEDCDLSMVTVERTSFQDVEFKHCKLLGVRFEQCKPLLLEFRCYESQLDFASFFGLKLSRLILENCALREADFVNAHLERARISGCDLSLAQFENTFMEYADLSESIGITMDPEVNFIRGAKFSNEALAGLLTKYQIEIDA